MIGILEAEREEKRKEKYKRQLEKQNRTPQDDEKKKLQFLSKFCQVTTTRYNYERA